MNPRLVEIVSEIFFMEVEEVGPDLSAESIDLWDSMNHLRLISAVEAEFAVKFSMDDIQNIDSLAKLDSLLAQKI